MRTRLPDRKISSYDKFQALRRKPSYRADYWDFMLWCREKGIDEADYFDHPEAAKKAEDLCQKYGITYLFHPFVDIPKHWESGFFIEEREIVEVLYPTAFRDLTEDEIEKEERPRFLPVPVFDGEENLIIKINLKADKDALIAKIIEQIDYYQYFVSKSKSRITYDRIVNKWKVWDIYNQTKSFKKTAEKIIEKVAFRVRSLNNIGYEAEFIKLINISTVRKAYYRAFELVHGEKFDPERHKPTKLPIRLRKTCDKCPERPNCEALCPEVLKYVSQDEKYQRETPKSEDDLELLASPKTGRKAPKPPME